MIIPIKMMLSGLMAKPPEEVAAQIASLSQEEKLAFFSYLGTVIPHVGVDEGEVMQALFPEWDLNLDDDSELDEEDDSGDESPTGL